MDLSIIIVNWKSGAYVRRCLASIFACAEGPSFEVIVVDNASYDDCGAIVAREFPRVKFVQSDENIGFGRANNLGFGHSRGRVLLFLNPDTEIAGPAVRILFEHLERLPRAGAVGCRLLNPDRSVQTSCVQSFPTILNQMLDSEFLRRLFPRSALWGIAPLYATGTGPAEVEAIEGACIMMRRDVFESIGMFSPDYFMYTEDIDLCYKARRGKCENYYVPQASIVHFGDGSVRSAKTNFAVVMAVESLWRFFKKYRGSAYANLYRGALFAAAAGRLALLSCAARRGAALKWLAILRWTVGLESWSSKCR